MLPNCAQDARYVMETENSNAAAKSKMTENADELLDEGLLHYQNGHFELAELALKAGLELEQRAWDHRLYLAMTYARLGRTVEAKREFMTIRDFCPESDMRKKAENALYALNVNKH